MLQAVKSRVWAAVVGEMKSSNTSEMRVMVSYRWCAGLALWDLKRQLSPLTKLHADVFVGILLPQLLITVCVTHEGENHILNDALKDKNSKVTIRQRD